jgi:transposase-like protein
VLDLVEAGHKVAGVAQDLGISDQTIYNWRRQDRIDRGLEPGRPSWRRRARASGSWRRSWRCTGGRPNCSRATPTQRRFAAIDVMVAEGLPAQVACRVLDVSESGFYIGSSGVYFDVECSPSTLVMALTRPMDYLNVRLVTEANP